MKFLGVLILLIVPVGITATKVFDAEKLSRFSLLLFIIASTFITLLWIRLDFKVNPSLFYGYISWNIKKNALIKRGILLLIMDKLLEEVNESIVSSTGILKYIFYPISRLYLRIGIVVMLVSGIIILFRPSRRRFNK